MQHKLKGIDQFTFPELQKDIENGGKFVVFQYCISPVVVSLRLLSAAFYVPSNSSKKLGLWYSLVSLILGWWGIPYGPVYTIQSLILNFKGGTDITNEIQEFLTEEGFDNRAVEIEETVNILNPVHKSDQKTFDKIFQNLYDNEALSFNNLEFKEYPYGQGTTFVLYLDPYDKYKANRDLILTYIYKKYFKRTKFYFVDIHNLESFEQDLKEKIDISLVDPNMFDSNLSEN